jgi:hypothetical protein
MVLNEKILTDYEGNIAINLPHIYEAIMNFKTKIRYEFFLAVLCFQNNMLSIKSKKIRITPKIIGKNFIQITSTV